MSHQAQNVPGGKYLGFLNKKSWHTSSLQNLEKVWTHEQQHERERRLHALKKKELEDEQQVEKLKAMQASNNLITHGAVPGRRRVEWMYSDGGALTGKNSELAFEQSGKTRDEHIKHLKKIIRDHELREKAKLAREGGTPLSSSACSSIPPPRPSSTSSKVAAAAAAAAATTAAPTAYAEPAPAFITSIGGKGKASQATIARRLEGLRPPKRVLKRGEVSAVGDNVPLVGIKHVPTGDRERDEAERYRIRVAERNISIDEKFPFLKGAPMEKHIRDVNQVKHNPLGLQVRNVKCLKCGTFGHRSGDRECPLYNEMTATAQYRVESQDPLRSVKEQYRLQSDKFSLLHNPGEDDTHGGLSKDNPLLQMLPSDDSEEDRGVGNAGDGGTTGGGTDDSDAEELEAAFLSTLSRKDMKLLLREYKREERNRRRKKKERKKHKKKEKRMKKTKGKKENMTTDHKRRRRRWRWQSKDDEDDDTHTRVEVKVTTGEITVKPEKGAVGNQSQPIGEEAAVVRVKTEPMCEDDVGADDLPPALEAVATAPTGHTMGGEEQPLEAARVKEEAEEEEGRAKEQQPQQRRRGNRDATRHRKDERRKRRRRKRKRKHSSSDSSGSDDTP